MLSGCSLLPQNQPHTYRAADILAELGTDNAQVVIVLADDADPTKATVSAWERRGEWWFKRFATFPAVIGRNGFAPPGEKREGDGRTPSGTYRLARAFGYAPYVSTGLDYRQVGETDFWVDDPASDQYNQWVKSLPQAASYEVLRRHDGLYEHAIVIEYNTEPVVAGNGSAIFLHVWRDAATSTAGCVALSPEHVKKLLKWLDLSKEPVIVLNDEKN